MKIIVANSVGVDSQGYRMIHYPSRWTTGAKRAYFFWYPWELACLSSLLKQRTSHSVKMIDGCRMELDAKRYTEMLAAERPDVLVMESSTRTIAEDLAVLKEVKRRTGCRLILTGQHASAYPHEIVQDVDYVCIGEYEFTVLDIVSGVKKEDIRGLYGNPPRDPFDIDQLPWPEDDDIKRIDYCTPGPPGLLYRQIQAYASRGCPFRCSFCVCSNLYYNQPVWRPRKRDDVVKELLHLKKKYGERMEGVFFDEECHNFSRESTIELCRKMIDAGLNKMQYTGMCMYRTLDEEVLEYMRKAGYYQLRVGIETASEKVAEAIGMKGKVDIQRLVKVLSAAKKLKLDIYGTFLIGAPGSSVAEDTKTVNLMKDLLKKELICELQISICTPQPGTPFFRDAEKNGWLMSRDWQRFDGTTESVISYPGYSNEQIEKVFAEATDIGHYYRGLISLKKEGLWRTAVKAWKRKGVMGSLKLLASRH